MSFAKRRPRTGTQRSRGPGRQPLARGGSGGSSSRIHSLVLDCYDQAKSCAIDCSACGGTELLLLVVIEDRGTERVVQIGVLNQ